MARRGSMQPGECRTTKYGRKFCYLPGVGVRFQPGMGGYFGPGKLADPGALRSCIAYKTVQTVRGPARRCAQFGPTTPVRMVSGFVRGPAGKRCLTFKTVPSRYGGRVRRCARFG